MGRLNHKRPLLDTNVIIERAIDDALLSKMVLSSVVLYELIATTIDDSTLSRYNSWRIALAATKQIVCPSPTDWFECSKVVRNLLRGQKSITKGNVRKVTSAQQQQNDALIARTAWTHDCFVVTNNQRDFNKFKPYMKGLEIVPADYFFDD